MSAKVIAFPRRQAEVTPTVAAAEWSRRAFLAQRRMAYLQAQMHRAVVWLARCEANARLCTKDPTCPPPRAAEESGSTLAAARAGQLSLLADPSPDSGKVST